MEAAADLTYSDSHGAVAATIALRTVADIVDGDLLQRSWTSRGSTSQAGIPGCSFFLSLF